MTNTKNFITLICFVVISITVVGYFTGLQAPMQTSAVIPGLLPLAADHTKPLAADTITATHYAEMHEATRHRTTAYRTSLTDLKSNVDPFAELKISAEDKTSALQRRDARRAFNGAPPTIPHAVSETSTAACIVCHGEGAKTETLRIPLSAMWRIIHVTCKPLCFAKVLSWDYQPRSRVREHTPVPRHKSRIPHGCEMNA